MPAEPVSVLDSLVKGIILTGYDFSRLTRAGFMLPFVGKMRRFRLASIVVHNRISSLTYLVLWVLLTASIGSQSGTQLASNVAGLEKTPAPAVTGTILLALLLSILVDLSVRATFSRFHCHIKREFYEALTRVAVANLFLGASIIMVIGMMTWDTTWGPFDFGPTVFLRIWNLSSSIPVFWRITNIPNPLLFLFSGSLVIIILKAFAIQDRLKKVCVALLIIFVVPHVLLNVSFQAYNLVDTIMLPWNHGAVYPWFTSCKISSGQVRVSGYLTLGGQEKALISTSYIKIMIYDGKMLYMLTNFRRTNIYLYPVHRLLASI